MKLEILRLYADEHGGKIQFSEAECEHSDPVRVQKINLKSACGCNNDILITHNRKEMKLEDWAKRLGVSPSVIVSRINAGWSIGASVTKPAMEKELG